MSFAGAGSRSGRSGCSVSSPRTVDRPPLVRNVSAVYNGLREVFRKMTMSYGYRFTGAYVCVRFAMSS